MKELKLKDCSTTSCCCLRIYVCVDIVISFTLKHNKISLGSISFCSVSVCVSQGYSPAPSRGRRGCIHLWTIGALAITSSLTLFFSLSHKLMCAHTELSGPAALCHRTPPLDHLNGTNPDCCKSSRVHAENGRERGSGEGR